MKAYQSIDANSLLGPGFYNSGRDSVTLAHELLHVGLGGNHFALTKALGITRPDGTYFGEGVDLSDRFIYDLEDLAATANLRKFLEGGCKK